MDKNIRQSIENHKILFDKNFKKLLKSILSRNLLSKAMIYGALNGGKRIRPFLISAFSEIAGLPRKKYFRLSAVAECIHTYSLIHDDLPSMDNDDFRRGKPSVHRQFDEGQAILAGDCLHDIAFELLSEKKTHNDAEIRIKLVHLLSSVIGLNGLAGGQSLDLIFENKNTDKSKVLNMYKMKTGALFSFCCMAPFIIQKKSSKDLNFANQYGEVFGIIFQIVDDYLDEVGNFNKLGKTPGKDKKQGKSTILQYLKKDEIIPYCENISNQFIKKNKNYFSKWNILKDLLLCFTRS